jgi:hypothetical protein
MGYQLQPYAPQAAVEMGTVPSFGALFTVRNLLMVAVAVVAYKYVTKPKRRKNPGKRRIGFKSSTQRKIEGIDDLIKQLEAKPARRKTRKGTTVIHPAVEDLRKAHEAWKRRKRTAKPATRQTTRTRKTSAQAKTKAYCNRKKNQFYRELGAGQGQKAYLSWKRAYDRGCAWSARAQAQALSGRNR